MQSDQQIAEKLSIRVLAFSLPYITVTLAEEDQLSGPGAFLFGLTTYFVFGHRSISPRPSLFLTHSHPPPTSTMKYFTLTIASAALSAALPTSNILQARAPPGVPTTAQAQSQLAGLTVAPQGSQTGYSRDLFPHWITQSG